MRETLHPSELEPRLAAEYIDVVCNEALDAAYRAIEAASTDDDTNWTLGTLTYGRVQGRFKSMNRNPELPWFLSSGRNRTAFRPMGSNASRPVF